MRRSQLGYMLMVSMMVLVVSGCCSMCETDSCEDCPTVDVEEGSEAEGPPPGMDVDPAGGGEGIPVESGTEAESLVNVRWGLVGGGEAHTGPPALDPTDLENPKINRRMVEYPVASLMATEAGSSVEVQSLELKVNSYCGGENTITIMKNDDGLLEWQLNGRTMSGRDPVVHENQLPCEFFGPMSGEVNAVKPDDTEFTAEKFGIEWAPSS